MATNLSQDPFSTAETYALKAQGYADLGDNAMAKIYGDLANSLGQYSGDANSTIGAYDNLLNFMSGNENKLQNVAGGLYNSLVNDINSQRTYVNDMFGPNGELTNEVNKYYDNLGNYLATDAGRQAAIIAAQGQHSGASLGAIRAQQNEAYNQSFQRYVQAKEQQINAKQQIASNLINFMSTLRQEYGDTTNQYIIEMYKRAYDLYNNVALSVGSDLSSLNQLRAASGGSGGGGGNYNITLPEGFTYDENTGYIIDKDGNKYTYNNGVLTKISDGSHITSSEESKKNKQLAEELEKINNTDYTKALKIMASAGFPWATPLIWKKELFGNKKE